MDAFIHAHIYTHVIKRFVLRWPGFGSQSTAGALCARKVNIRPLDCQRDKIKMRWLSATMPTLPFIFLFLSTYLRSSHAAYSITVDAHAQECFHENVKFGTKMGLTFEIAEGGFLDIDVTIVGPDNKVIFDGQQESSGKFTFAAHTSGEYRYCFSNVKGTMTPKVVMFDMDVTEIPDPNDAAAAAGAHEGDSANAKLDDMIKELSHTLLGVHSEQEYMQVRDKNHRMINESTNFRVVVWSFFEATALVCMTLGQVYYLKRFFEVRRVV
ncbi:hypothetical protein QAD02_016658 [Eretmocerus hayati]|uniref:Uncharacterized protein n=1 Tax=Eretmocerus hayati TaxID=131215 RepID=A0ACC2PBP8_9HYME|nr:hypothetical protein QAD02_016658 [Eretmocerus hayati]